MNQSSMGLLTIEALFPQLWAKWYTVVVKMQPTPVLDRCFATRLSSLSLVSHDVLAANASNSASAALPVMGRRREPPHSNPTKRGGDSRNTINTERSKRSRYDSMEPFSQWIVVEVRRNTLRVVGSVHRPRHLAFDLRASTGSSSCARVNSRKARPDVSRFMASVPPAWISDWKRTCAMSTVKARNRPGT